MKKLLFALPIALLASACATDKYADAINRRLEAPASPERCNRARQLQAQFANGGPELNDARERAAEFLRERCPDGR